MNKTNIPWADFTWNPITGCTKGCDYCYARGIARRFTRIILEDGEPARGGSARAVMYEHRLDEPLRLKKPATIFLGSMGDPFDPAFPDEFRDRIFGPYDGTVRACANACIGHSHQQWGEPWQTFMVLTKQPEEMRRYFKRYYKRLSDHADRFKDCTTEAMRTSPAAQWFRFEADNPPPNLWLGVTVTNQADADERIPLLLDTPAAHRFVSVEPMLGPVDLSDYLYEMDGGDFGSSRLSLDAVIVGGKTPGKPLHEQCPTSGRLTDFAMCRAGCGEFCPHNCRPSWLRSLRNQCLAAGVPFHYKHAGTNPALDGVVYDWKPGDAS